MISKTHKAIDRYMKRLGISSIYWSSEWIKLTNQYGQLTIPGDFGAQAEGKVLEILKAMKGSRKNG